MYKQLYAVTQTSSWRESGTRIVGRVWMARKVPEIYCSHHPRLWFFPKSLHPPRAQAGQKRSHQHKDIKLEVRDVNTLDQQEAGLPLSNSTYDACQDSFIAADREHIEASMNYFVDTGVMAMLCWHDLPLFMVNVQTAGEKQFYLFALLAKLFKHIPPSWCIGILYDIGCQGDQTLQKWDFVPQWQTRIVWGVSIFHAYGHQYACQLWYHPQKCEVWGLTDGEGCERFWSQLCQLVPGLQVMSHHWCLFLLDMQAEHIDSMKLPDAGKWLSQDMNKATGRAKAAREWLVRESTVSTTFLLSQFEDQWHYYSQPVDWQSKWLHRKHSIRSCFSQHHSSLKKLYMRSSSSKVPLQGTWCLIWSNQSSLKKWCTKFWG